MKPGKRLGLTVVLSYNNHSLLLMDKNYLPHQMDLDTGKDCAFCTPLQQFSLKSYLCPLWGQEGALCIDGRSPLSSNFGLRQCLLSLQSLMSVGDYSVTSCWKQMVDISLGSRASCSLNHFLRNWELQCMRDSPFNWGFPSYSLDLGAAWSKILMSSSAFSR